MVRTGEQAKNCFGQKNGASYGHAATSPDGKFLVFTSDMKDGYGGKDLYILSPRR